MNGAIHYMVGGEDRYLVGRESLTQREYDAARAEIERKDEECGYCDRMNHYYDKWYRYNRADEGAAYDRGVRRAVDAEHSAKWLADDEKNFHIIGG